MVSAFQASSSHYRIEFFLTDQTVVVQVSTLDHLLQFGIVNRFSHLLYYSSKVLYWNKARFLVVEKCKYLFDIILGVLNANSRCQKIEKFAKINTAIDFSDCVEQSLVFGLETEGGHGCEEIYMSDVVPLESIDPCPSTSNNSKASLISETSSEEMPGRSYYLGLKGARDLAAPVLVFFIERYLWA